LVTPYITLFLLQCNYSVQSNINEQRVLNIGFLFGLEVIAHKYAQFNVNKVLPFFFTLEFLHIHISTNEENANSYVGFILSHLVS